MESTLSTGPGAGRHWLWIAALAAAVAGWLLWFAPDTLGPLSTGLTGSALMLVAVWTLVHYMSSSMPDPASDVRFGEKEAWIDLGMTLIIGLYLFTKLAALGWEIDIQTRAAQHIGTNIALMIVGATILTQRLHRREGEATIADERDDAIRLRAGSRSHTFLVVAIVVLIFALAFNPADRLSFLTPDTLAHALIGLLLFAETFRHAAELWYYRLDRA